MSLYDILLDDLLSKSKGKLDRKSTDETMTQLSIAMNLPKWRVLISYGEAFFAYAGFKEVNMEDRMREIHMKPYTFNLKIIFYARHYPEGVWDILAEVTYPEQVFPSAILPTHTFPSVAVKYDRSGDDNPDKVAERMVRDIVSFVRNPQVWEENYVAQSSDLGQKIKHLQEDLEDLGKHIAQDSYYLEQQKQQYAHLLQQLTELQAKLNENT